MASSSTCSTSRKELAELVLREMDTCSLSSEYIRIAQAVKNIANKVITFSIQDSAELSIQTMLEVENLVSREQEHAVAMAKQIIAAFQKYCNFN